MRVNTTRSLRLASRVKQRYGSWQAVKAASRLENGIHVLKVLPSSEMAHTRGPKTDPICRASNIGTPQLATRQIQDGDLCIMTVRDATQALAKQLRITKLLLAWITITTTLTLCFFLVALARLS